ncbi:hypothetical protein PCANC_17908 [Puccinia coronata f. sp. avenae]|uniref:Uncharacterized protein n=1 Tax=Puccinia coronata f. sp. avenae TaxID=200324 RepID=A0A2N5UDV5_9BASI|nr:hypothetical protein PCANC_17908 [Puccinia coronata f. sp. avenae]
MGLVLYSSTVSATYDGRSRPYQFWYYGVANWVYIDKQQKDNENQQPTIFNKVWSASGGVVSLARTGTEDEKLKASNGTRGPPFFRPGDTLGTGQMVAVNASHRRQRQVTETAYSSWAEPAATTSLTKVPAGAYELHHGCSSLCVDGFPERLVAASVMKTPRALTRRSWNTSAQKGRRSPNVLGQRSYSVLQSIGKPFWFPIDRRTSIPPFSQRTWETLRMPSSHRFENYSVFKSFGERQDNTLPERLTTPTVLEATQ